MDTDALARTASEPPGGCLPGSIRAPEFDAQEQARTFLTRVKSPQRADGQAPQMSRTRGASRWGQPPVAIRLGVHGGRARVRSSCRCVDSRARSAPAHFLLDKRTGGANFPTTGPERASCSCSRPKESEMQSGAGRSVGPCRKTRSHRAACAVRHVTAPTSAARPSSWGIHRAFASHPPTVCHRLAPRPDDGASTAVEMLSRARRRLPWSLRTNAVSLAPGRNEKKEA
jgi:hypothetical protein